MKELKITNQKTLEIMKTANKKIKELKMQKKRYSYKYKFVTSQPNEKGEYYIYRFETKKKAGLNIVVAYILRDYEVEYLDKTVIPITGYNEFKKFQEKIEKRRFY